MSLAKNPSEVAWMNVSQKTKRASDFWGLCDDNWRGGRLLRWTPHKRLIKAISGLGGQLLAPFFFLLAFLGKISLTLFELIVWFGQEASSSAKMAGTGEGEISIGPINVSRKMETRATIPQCKTPTGLGLAFFP